MYSKSLDNLGLVASMVDKLQISEIVDSLVPQDMASRNVSIGVIVKAMIINGLAFEQRTLYKMEEFFGQKPIELLLGKDVRPEYLNDSVVGRALDEIQKFGTTELFSAVAAKAFHLLGLAMTNNKNIDSTSFHADGQYNTSDDGTDDTAIRITKGYSRDHRPDLNQAILHMIVDNLAGLPMFMKACSGNTSDKTEFRDILLEHAKHLHSPEQIGYIVGDSALYTEETIRRLSPLSLWVSRVPETVGGVKELIRGLDPKKMTPADGEMSQKYRYTPAYSEFAGVKQQWLAVWSSEAYERELYTLNKNIEKTAEKEIKLLKKFEAREFACCEDAEKEFIRFEKTIESLKLENRVVAIKPHYPKAGKPKKGSEPDKTSYSVSVGYRKGEGPMCERRHELGFFVLATNDLEVEPENYTIILETYKGQSKVERGFRFMKDPWFMANTFFVKKPERVETILMLMTMSLLVFGALEYDLRKNMRENNVTIRDQVKKQTNKPTMRYIFEIFKNIICLYDDQKVTVLNLKPDQLSVLKQLGAEFVNLYGGS